MEGGTWPFMERMRSKELKQDVQPDVRRWLSLGDWCAGTGCPGAISVSGSFQKLAGNSPEQPSLNPELNVLMEAFSSPYHPIIL